MTVTLGSHQQFMAQSWAEHPEHVCFNTSDPGTGKTLGAIAGFDLSKTKNRKRMLVLAPLSILKVAWWDDIDKYGSYVAAIAHGNKDKREAVMRDTDLDVVITNHDAVKWIMKDPTMVDHFTHLVVDESTAYKNAQTQRFKALMKMLPNFTFIQALTGTPNPNTVMDLWAQTFLLDKGQRLGKSFFAMRAACCTPQQVGRDPRAVQWFDKPDALDYAFDKLKDITVRFTLEECTDIPEQAQRELWMDMPKWVNDAYEKLEKEAVLEMATGKVTAVHAGILVKKLLQLLSGAIYDEHGNIQKLHTERYDLVTQLILERKACVVAYNWRHELEAMTELADKAGIKYGIINGSVNPNKRAEYIDAFQAGELQVLYCHPAAAAHGITLTRGTATIWASPTYSSEQYQQFNRRIYRTGQTKKTETIRIGYRNSREVDVYNKLDGKLVNMTSLLSLFTQITTLEKTA